MYSLKTHRIQANLILFCLLSLLASSCSYSRGFTHYNFSLAKVDQDMAENPTVASRSFEGIRVAGKDTDIIPKYWDNVFHIQGKMATFETFEARYQDLTVYNSYAAKAALTSFKRWCKRRKISYDFNYFWGTPS